MKSKTYSEKLRDPRWQKLRLEVMQRDGFKCLCCGATDKTLHVHHLFYVNGGNPWDTKEHLLETLCESCHAKREDWDTAMKCIGTARVMRFATSVMNFARAQSDAGQCYGMRDAVYSALAAGAASLDYLSGRARDFSKHIK